MERSRENNGSLQIQHLENRQAVKVTAANIFREHERNKISADNKYENKYVEISGTIDDIGKDIQIDLPIVSLYEA